MQLLLQCFYLMLLRILSISFSAPSYACNDHDSYASPQHTRWNMRRRGCMKISWGMRHITMSPVAKHGHLCKWNLKYQNPKEKSPFIITHSPFLITHSPFLGKPECIPPPLERFPTQQGVEKQVGLRWLFCKKQNSWASHFQTGKKQTRLVMC